MAFLPLRIDGATSSFKAPLVVLQDRTSNCLIQTKRKQHRLPELLSIYWVHIWKSWFLKCHAHIHCDFLTTSSPAEGKVRSIGGNCGWWRMRASCLITLASVSIARSVWQISQVVSMKLLHVMRRNLIQVHPIWSNLCKSNKNQNMGSLQKPGFSRKKYFFHWSYNFLGLWSSWCIYIYTIFKGINMYDVYSKYSMSSKYLLQP